MSKNLFSLLTKERLISIAIHTVILTLLVLIALFINATVKGPEHLPALFFKSNFSLNLLLNFCFFYAVYVLYKWLKIRVTMFTLTTLLLVLLLASTAASVLLDLSFVGSSFNINNNQSRYFLAINSISKIFYMCSALLTMGLVNLFIQKRQYSQLRLLTAETELAILKTQTNPHFLFNVFNALYASAYKSGDIETADGIGRMSGLMRYALHSNQQEFVTLEQEIEYIEQFIFLQKLRFNKILTVNFSYENADLSQEISPMLLMPIIENAFKYGIISSTKNHIEIILKSLNNKISCEVSNHDHSEQIKASSHFLESGTGLVNLTKRLKLLYPDKSSLKIDNSSGNYTIKLIIK